jgi:hypothetical protein
VIWVPLLLWLAFEIHLLESALSVTCEPQPGGDRMEVFLVMFLTGLPGTLLTFVPSWFFDPCTTYGCVVLWFFYCSVVLVQWYYILRGLDWAATRLLRAVVTLARR